MILVIVKLPNTLLHDLLIFNNGNDVSQNMTASLVLTDRLTMNVIHKDVAGTLDISGYTVNYSVLGGNTDAGSFTKTATNKDATDSNTDVLISGLNYPNSVYDMSVNLFNAYDMSNTFIDISGLNKT